MTAETLRELLEQLNNMNFFVRSAARAKLVTLGGEVVGPLIEAMQSGENPLCWEAANVLAEIRDERSFAPLEEALVSTNLLLGQAATKALERFGERAVLSLAVALCQPDVKLIVKIGYVTALEHLQDRRAVPALMATLRETTNVTLRYTTIQALGILGDSQALDLIRPYRDDPDHHTRKRARAALQRLGENLPDEE